MPSREAHPFKWYIAWQKFGQTLDDSLPKSYSHTLRTKYGTFQANSLLGIIWEVLKYHCKRLAAYRIW